jgi:hypothetical protein
MSNDTSVAPRTRQMVLAINVPAYVTVEVPEEVAETEEALREFAEAQFAGWWDDNGELEFEPEWGSAIRETERIVSVTEEEGGEVLRYIAEALDLDPPPAAFKAVAGAESACREGLVVEGYLLASTAHLTLSERQHLAAGDTRSTHVVISATCEYGCLLHLNEQLLGEETETDQALANLSEGFAGVILKAIVYGLPFVRFDADGPVIEGISTYDDKEPK